VINQQQRITKSKKLNHKLCN